MNVGEQQDIRPGSILDRIRKRNRAVSTNRLASVLKDEKWLRMNYERRNNPEGEWSGMRTRRQILDMPPELFLAVEERHPGIFKDRSVLKEALQKDEVLRSYLTVPLNTI